MFQTSSLFGSHKIADSKYIENITPAEFASVLSGMFDSIFRNQRKVDVILLILVPVFFFFFNPL